MSELGWNRSTLLLPSPPAAPETALEKSEFTFSGSFDPYILQPCPSAAPYPPEHYRLCFCFVFFRKSAPTAFSTQFRAPTQPAPLLAPKTTNQQDFYPTSVTVSGIGQHKPLAWKLAIFIAYSSDSKACIQDQSKMWPHYVSGSILMLHKGSPNASVPPTA